MHALVVPSTWYESTPLVLCSALAAGTFALVSRLGGMTEVIVEGENGFSFAAEDAGDVSRPVPWTQVCLMKPDENLAGPDGFLGDF